MVPAIVRTEPVPDAERFERGERFLLQLRVRRQAEIIVRGEIDDLAAVDASPCGLLVVEHAEAAIKALRLEGVELVGEKAKRVVAHK